MSKVTKIVALLLLLVALGLVYLATRIAVQPPPPPAAPVVVRSQNATAVHPVVVAARAIEAGAPIDPASLAVAQWPVAPAGAFDAPAKLANAVSRVTILPGEPVTQFQLARGLATYLKPGERAVAIAVDEIIGAGNRIRPGDTVDVFITLERGQEVGGTQARLLQSRVRVLAYGSRSLDGPDAEEKAAAQRNGPAPAPRNAMLAVPVAQVNELLLAARAGRLQLALRAPDDADVPAPGLFPARQPVLAARANLSVDEQALAADAVNRAYAGDSLPQLSGPAPRAETPAPAHAARPARGGGRSIEVVRGGQRETVSY
ncbi:Flp pilus assembly protein CpaB [Achromobacter aloeverae]|uniref:Flp pilus assembly protein CpaB n=1 Tax=Achromobacter aloeverae TaxID=1750518 RepID=A0A4Q1HQ78_9BURK|nr:Flp pilus assembly protein CpaB [Achromobacter aloeverae]RXN93218.1 Flp pilus assembly protein CpaB [Achromobacter aloeverae]